MSERKHNSTVSLWVEGVVGNGFFPIRFRAVCFRIGRSRRVNRGMVDLSIFRERPASLGNPRNGRHVNRVRTTHLRTSGRRWRKWCDGIPGERLISPDSGRFRRSPETRVSDLYAVVTFSERLRLHLTRT